MFEYVLDNSIWSLGGLVLGYVLGRMERQIFDIKKKVESSDDDS